MASVLHRFTVDDAELARRVGAGDDAAFALLDARHRSALTHYAGSLLRRSEHDAQDIVQDVLIRAHTALRAGDAPDELRPWLYRLTRNRAIDEVRRKRWGDEALLSDTTFSGDERQDPETVLRHKETMRRLVEDLAGLPLTQRTALLARELDDQSAEQVAAQLGVSVMAAHRLTARARENLIKSRDARDAACPDVRVTLLDAHERGVRTSEHAVRHVKGCQACHAYQRDFRRLSKQLHALNPAFGLPLLAGLAKLAGGGGAKAAAGAAAVVAVAATGGIVVLKSEVHSPGDPAPFRLMSIRDSKGRPVTRGTPVPEGFTIVTARIRLPAGPSTLPKNPRGPLPSITLPCPKGMKIASMQLPDRELSPAVRALGYSEESIPGYSTSGVIQIGHRGLDRPLVFTVGLDCRRPGAYGSIFAVTPGFRAALERGERRLGRICTNSRGVHVRDSPGGHTLGYPNRGAPVAILRRNSSRTWTRIHTDTSDVGWVRTSEVCP